MNVRAEGKLRVPVMDAKAIGNVVIRSAVVPKITRAYDCDC